MKTIDEFEDYLLIMRLPPDLLVEMAPQPTDSKSEFHDGRKVLWVIAGIHGKATQAGVSFLGSDCFSALYSYLSNQFTRDPPEFFEAVFRIPAHPEKMRHFSDLKLGTLADDRRPGESNLVYFQELHTRKEPGVRDSRPFNIARHFCSEEQKPAQVSINTVHLDVVADCNFDCQDCFESGLRRLRSRLSLATICKILVDLREVGCKRLRFDGGEPTLHPNFSVIVRLAAALGFEMDLVTNGSKLSDPEIQQAIVSARELIQLRVSLSGYSLGISQMPLPPDLLEHTKKAVLEPLKKEVKVSVSMLLYKNCIQEVEDSCRFWPSHGARVCLLPVLKKGGAGQACEHEWTRNDKRKLKEIIAQSSDWVIVPNWYHNCLNRDECANTAKNYEQCYSAYYRVAISPAKDSCGELRQAKSGLEVRDTDRAWISLCPHHRHDHDYGCDYPHDEGGLTEWMKGRRLEIAKGIKPHSDKCQETICSSDMDNRQTHQEIKKTKSEIG